MPFNISSLLCKVHICGLILKFRLGWGGCYFSAHFPYTVFVSTAIYTVWLGTLYMIPSRHAGRSRHIGGQLFTAQCTIIAKLLFIRVVCFVF